MSNRVLCIAKEDTYGGIQAGSPSPDHDDVSFVWIPVRCDRDGVVPGGEPTIVQREETRAGFHERPSEPVTIYDGGVPVPRRQGEIQVTMRALLLGDGTLEIPDYDAHPLALMLASTLAEVVPTTALMTVLTPGGKNSFDVADASGFLVGELLRLIQDGIASYTAITKIDGEDITCSPDLAKDLLVADVLRRMRTYVVPRGGLTPGKSLAIRQDGVGWRTIYSGCRWNKLQISQDGGELLFNFTFLSKFIRDYHDHADVISGANLIDPYTPDGGMSALLGGRSVISTTPSNEASAGAALAATQIHPEEDWALDISVELKPRGRTDNILGTADLEVDDVKVEMEGTISEIFSFLDSDLDLGRERSVMIGAGVSKDAGTGLAVYIPSAVLTSQPSVRDVNGDVIRQKPKWTMGQNRLDATVPGDGVLPGSLFRLGLGL